MNNTKNLELLETIEAIEDYMNCNINGEENMSSLASSVMHDLVINTIDLNELNKLIEKDKINVFKYGFDKYIRLIYQSLIANIYNNSKVIIADSSQNGIIENIKIECQEKNISFNDGNIYFANNEDEILEYINKYDIKIIIVNKESLKLSNKIKSKNITILYFTSNDNMDSEKNIFDISLRNKNSYDEVCISNKNEKICYYYTNSFYRLLDESETSFGIKEMAINSLGFNSRYLDEESNNVINDIIRNIKSI